MQISIQMIFKSDDQFNNDLKTSLTKARGEPKILSRSGSVCEGSCSGALTKLYASIPQWSRTAFLAHVQLTDKLMSRSL